MTLWVRLARRLLDVTLPARHRDVVLAHLDEEHAHVIRTQSTRSATRWYRRQVAGSLVGALQMRMSPPDPNHHGAPQRRRLSRLLTEVAYDMRYGARQLRNAPGFAIAAVLMLSIGLGLVAGGYTVVNGMFVRGWDVPDTADVFRATAVRAGAPAGGRIDDGLSYGAYKHLRAHGRAADYFAFDLENKRLGVTRETAVYSAGFFVSDNFIEAVRIPLQRGTGFIGTADGPRVVLSDKLWRGAFQQDPGIVGRTIWVSGQTATVVGVTAPGFGNLGERAVDFLMELSASPLWAMAGRTDIVRDEHSCCVSIGGRVRQGRSLPVAAEELKVLTAQYRTATAQPELTITIRDTSPMVPADRGVALVFGLIGAAVILVWGLTCANVGNLFLARSLKRDKEIAVRLALGATRGRLVRQLLAEGLVLAGLAGTVALALAAGVPKAFERFDSTAKMFAPDALVVTIAGLATIVTCLIVALAPALHATRINWRGAGRTSTASAGRMREVVLAVQIGVATVLVLGATLLGRGILQASSSRADFALHTTSVVHFQLPSNASTKQIQDTRVALHAALRDTGEFAIAESAPVSARVGSQTSVRPVSGNVEFRARLLQMSSGAFDVLEIPILDGRRASDAPDRNEAVINETLAKRISPDGRAVGMVLHLNFDNQSYTVVGVTPDVHLLSLADVEPMMHTTQINSLLGVALARTGPGVADRVAALAKGVDPALSVQVTPLSDGVRSSMQTALGGAAVASGLAAVALLLAVIGVFGVFSYLIEERRREIGIRLALGASRRQVRTALTRACRRAVIGGVVGGLVLSVLAGHALRGFLFGLSPLDPISYITVSMVLTVAAIGATAIPVRRATGVDPAVTLRAE